MDITRTAGANTYSISIVRWPALGACVEHGGLEACCDAGGRGWYGALAIDRNLDAPAIHDAILRVVASGLDETVTIGTSCVISHARRASIADEVARHESLMVDMARADSDR